MKAKFTVKPPSRVMLCTYTFLSVVKVRGVDGSRVLGLGRTVSLKKKRTRTNLAKRHKNASIIGPVNLIYQVVVISMLSGVICL